MVLAPAVTCYICVPSANAFELKYTSNLTDYNDDSHWETLDQIKPEDVVSGKFEPVAAGETVTFEVPLDFFAAQDIYYFAIRASDEGGLKSPISTPFQLNTDIFPPGKVTDLKTELVAESVQISFTAPGDDNITGIGNIKKK